VLINAACNDAVPVLVAALADAVPVVIVPVLVAVVADGVPVVAVPVLAAVADGVPVVAVPVLVGIPVVTVPVLVAVVTDGVPVLGRVRRDPGRRGDRSHHPAHHPCSSLPALLLLLVCLVRQPFTHRLTRLQGDAKKLG